ncbi:immunity protein [Pseudomonas sp. CCM 7893]|uniref:Immunity protein n=1 Tax=Pseudomonas spelaei TaxID=1055469 RepID=A0A6I3WKS3_9PSED|nr:immunity protein [Pseudomonas spelaei]MUF07829.1 immunity protein [Pseudomonas spelaei]
MLDLESVYKNESVEDVLLYFALRTTYPNIDRMYVSYKFEVVGCGALLQIYQRLLHEGNLVENKNPLPEKGPYWKESAFITEKRYIIEGVLRFQ